MIEISDNGPGIPKAYRNNIFEKFVRAGNNEWGTKSGSGLGLGLNISHKIVQKMGGKLELIDGKLSGACFRLTLPCHGERRGAPRRKRFRIMNRPTVCRRLT